MIMLTEVTIEEVKKIPVEYFREHIPLRYERAGRYRFEADRLRCLGAGLLMERVLGVREEEIRTGEHGKPYIPGKDMGFSVSHSGSFVVLASGNGSIGTDIEKKDPGHLKVAGRVFTEEERKWMEADPEERFFRLWTLKESVMKALGRGFSLPPESFCVLPALEGKPMEIEGRLLYARCIPKEGYGLAVCCDRSFTELPTEIHRLNINLIYNPC